MSSFATLSECTNTPSNGQKAFDGIIANDVPKLYICASWGFETKDDFVDYLKWMNRQIEINKLGKAKNENPTDETVDELLEQCEELRNSILIPYINKMGNCRLICLGGDHMIYEQKPEECGIIIKEFIDGLVQ